MARFRDRAEAGRLLAELLRDYKGREDVVVLALPRGGVPVAYEVAEALGLPLDVFVVRKLGAPGHPELAMGAIASGGLVVLKKGVAAAPRVYEGRGWRGLHLLPPGLLRRQAASSGTHR